MTSRSEREDALATLDAWLASTKDAHPLAPGYWPPPVAFHEWQKPRRERVSSAATPPKTRARPPWRR
jgi:hypothetical protein